MWYFRKSATISITKKETTVSEKKWAPEAILDAETRTPNPTLAVVTARFLLATRMNASAKKAPAESPDENEQLWSQASEITKAGVVLRPAEFRDVPRSGAAEVVLERDVDDQAGPEDQDQEQVGDLPAVDCQQAALRKAIEGVDPGDRDHRQDDEAAHISCSMRAQPWRAM